jgi:hypothetical protein
MRHRLAVFTSIILLPLLVASCAGLKFGKEFPSPRADSIKNGATTKADLERMFGAPNQVGIKDGDQTWTWLYAVQGGKEDMAKQLDVTFGAQGVVKSYSFSSSFPEDMKTR